MNGTILMRYLKEHEGNINSKMAAYVAELETVSEVNPQAAASIVNELKNQRSRLKLIASENYSSLAIQLSMGNLLTDKYSEGYPKHRYYAGCENVDAVEQDAVDTAKRLFGADHAYVQPHSGADANLVAYWAVLDAKVIGPEFEKIKAEHEGVKTYDDLFDDEWNRIRTVVHNQKLLSLGYGSGSHLTHGYRMNVSAQMFECHHYEVNENGRLDYDAIEKQAMEIKPLILLAGYSAYPRKINFKRFREIADKCGAVLMVDMAHFAGLVAGKVYTDEYDPVKWADIVTTTTHKTLRGPRGGLILCKEWLKDSVNKGCPLVLGGPLPHVMAAKATALKEASDYRFQVYAERIVANAKVLADTLMTEGAELQTNGTENHLMVLKTGPFGLTGRQAENALLECNIILNRNAIPDDPEGPWYTSGLRLGTPAVTTLGMQPSDMEEIASIIVDVLKHTKSVRGSKTKYILDEKVKENSKRRVAELLNKYVLYPELDLDFLEEAFLTV